MALRTCKRPVANVPAQCRQLRGPEAVAVSDQDSRGIPMPAQQSEREYPRMLPACGRFRAESRRAN
jgi:hypothetical protein